LGLLEGGRANGAYEIRPKGMALAESLASRTALDSNFDRRLVRE
jgi:hypothetical protein